MKKLAIGFFVMMILATFAYAQEDVVATVEISIYDRISEMYTKIITNDKIMYALLILVVVLFLLRNKIMKYYTEWVRRRRAAQLPTRNQEVENMSHDELFSIVPSRRDSKINTIAIPANISDAFGKRAEMIEVALKKDIDNLEKKRRVELRALKQRLREVYETKKGIERLVLNLRDIHQKVLIQEEVTKKLIESIEITQSG